MKYSFILSYYKRPVQFNNALLSFRHFYGNRNDYEIILIIDVKNTKDDLDKIYEVINNFKDVNIKHHIFDAPGADSDYNHVRLLNDGARKAYGEYLIISMPEIFHVTDVLGGLDKIYAEKPNAYVVCSCAASKMNTVLADKFEDVKYATSVWYQHPQKRNKMIYFFACMKKDFYWEIGGSNEVYAKGVTHEDTSFRMRVIHSGVEIITPDDLLVIHQNHENISELFGSNIVEPRLRDDLARIRLEMKELEELKKTQGFSTAMLREFIAAKDKEARLKYND